MAALNNDKSYKIIAEAIRKLGKPNPKFAGDIDAEYGDLKNELGEKIGGLMALLRTMKKQNLIDYTDQGILQPTSVVTLLAGSGLLTNSDQVSYDKIKDVISDSDKTSHNRIGAGSTAVNQ